MGTTGVRCAWTLIVVRESYPLTTKVVLLQERPRDKVRRRVTLLVPARCDGMTGQAVTAWRETWDWLLFVVRMLPSLSDDNGHLREILIMRLMDRCQ